MFPISSISEAEKFGYVVPALDVDNNKGVFAVVQTVHVHDFLAGSVQHIRFYVYDRERSLLLDIAPYVHQDQFLYRNTSLRPPEFVDPQEVESLLTGKETPVNPADLNPEVGDILYFSGRTIFFAAAEIMEPMRFTLLSKLNELHVLEELKAKGLKELECKVKQFSFSELDS